MSLEDYQRKRQFDVTHEPSGETKLPKGQRFVVQKHAASRLHYDFRLETAGVLKSWAVPHGPSLDPSIKSLAVEVEDHPVSYVDFEGTIPKGEYGGGTVMVWDRGHWELDDDGGDDDRELSQLLASGKATFRLFGEKLGGLWSLIRMKNRGEKNWLLIKKADTFATSSQSVPIIQSASLSVVTGRNMEEIAAGQQPHIMKKTFAKSSITTRRNTTATKDAPKAAAKDSARGTYGAPLSGNQSRRKSSKSPQDRFAEDAQTGQILSRAPRANAKQIDGLRPQLATLSLVAPIGKQWVHEIKLDGYRILARIVDGTVRLLTRSGLDWTNRFSSIADAVAKSPLVDAMLDGEVVALNERGVSDFQRLQNCLKQGKDTELIYYVFDLPFVGQRDLTGLPLIDRKGILANALLGHAPENSGILRYHHHITGSGREVLQGACGHAMEGIVSKQRSSPYVARRSETWLKIKCTHQQEFVVAGYTEPSGQRSALGALLLGFYDGQDLIYCGRVGTGFTAQSLRDLGARLKLLEIQRSPFAQSSARSQTRGITWVKPELVAEISYATRTQDGLLRHAVFHGLREDKSPREVKLEKAAALPKGTHALRTQSTLLRPSESIANVAATNKSTSRSAASAKVQSKPDVFKTSKLTSIRKAAVLLAEAEISHPERIVYRDPELTKLDVAKYFAAVAPWMLPGVLDRPLSLLRCPQGSFGPCFYQKHLEGTVPPGVRVVSIAEDKQKAPYAVIEAASGLVSLAQLNVLEFHLWPAMAADVEHPDRLIFDLDPGEDVEWSWVVNGARDVRKTLKQVGIESFVRTSGGKGLHVVAPLNRNSGDWNALKDFASLLAHALVERHPDRYVAKMTKSLRKGKVYIDYLRNQRGATAIANYSPRARVGACVATPLRWSELSRVVSNADFTINNILERVRRQKTDPWNGFDAIDQQLKISAATPR